MDFVKFSMVILSVVIVLAPIAGVLYIYRENLPGLLLLPQVDNLLKGNQTLPEIQLPQPTEMPQYDSQTGAFIVSFAYTNPFGTPITISALNGEVKAEDYNVPLGNVSLAKPLTLQPKQTTTITATGLLDPNAVKQIKAQDPTVTSIEVSLHNVNVTAGGISVQIGDIPNVGRITLPGGS